MVTPVKDPAHVTLVTGDVSGAVVQLVAVDQSRAVPSSMRMATPVLLDVTTRVSARAKSARPGPAVMTTWFPVTRTSRPLPAADAAGALAKSAAPSTDALRRAASRGRRMVGIMLYLARGCGLTAHSSGYSHPPGCSKAARTTRPSSGRW